MLSSDENALFEGWHTKLQEIRIKIYMGPQKCLPEVIVPNYRGCNRLNVTWHLGSNRLFHENLYLMPVEEN